MKVEQEAWQQLAEDVGVYAVLPKSVEVLCELALLGSESIKENVRISFRSWCTKLTVTSSQYSQPSVPFKLYFWNCLLDQRSKILFSFPSLYFLVNFASRIHLGSLLLFSDVWLSWKIYFFLKFIQNISPFLIGSKPPAKNLHNQPQLTKFGRCEATNLTSIRLYWLEMRLLGQHTIHTIHYLRFQAWPP